MNDRDLRLMRRALELARQGDPSPNPMVGAVVARDDEIVGEGFHAVAGKEHAEVLALAAAGDAARGQTLYVTLEPCNHTGRTPPCTEAIVAAGVRRVVIGCRDPNPNVEGGGIERLEAAGIEVVAGVAEAAARDLIAPWTKYVTRGLPWVALKLAVSLDGRVATRTGASRWITGPDARARVHRLRAQHDAVLVGVNTVISDDPQLTVREVQGRHPVRVVVDSKLRLPITSTLVATAHEIPTCVVCTADAPDDAREALKALGVTVIQVDSTAEGRCDIADMLRALGEREVVSILCEGGAELAGTLLAAELADAGHIFVAPILLGPRGRAGAMDWAGPEVPSQAPRIEPAKWELCGSDAYLSGRFVYPRRGRAEEEE